ncbi:hypothetical protein BDZ97DRAFT_919812 [Flammula alnicola]|nr:hypothetical protein BDZ97DRAFT_919812 [Flammula alnicola]
MTTSEDRKPIAIMNGLSSHADYRDASGSKPRWKQPPTTIETPSNNTPMRQAHPSGTNPFGQRPSAPKNNIRNERPIGNQTSSRTMVDAGRDRHNINGPPPPKRQKIDHTFTSPTIPKSKLPQTRKNAPSTPEDREVINVDDDSNHEHSPDRRRSYQNGQSSDELNLRSNDNAFPDDLPSKYTFSPSDHRPMGRNLEAGIAPDGKNTKWVDEKYGDKGIEDSDPISEFSSHPGEVNGAGTSKGHVSRMVKTFEASGEKIDDKPARKVDLTKPPGKAKMKRKLYHPGL